MKKNRIRVSYNLKPTTIELVRIYADMINMDMSFCVDQALEHQLYYLIQREITKQANKPKKPLKEQFEEQLDAFEEANELIEGLKQKWHK